MLPKPLIYIYNIVSFFCSMGKSKLIGNKINVPKSISEQSQAVLKKLSIGTRNLISPSEDDEASWGKINNFIESGGNYMNEIFLKKYNPIIKRYKLNGIPVIEVNLETRSDENEVLVYVHGGGFTLCSAESTLHCAILLSYYTGKKVISIEYTLAPKSDWQIVIGEVILVIDALLENYSMTNISFSGHSAGGSIVCGSVLKMLSLGYDKPKAILLLSPWLDLSKDYDTYEILKHQDPILNNEDFLQNSALAYAGCNLKNPFVSPIYSKHENGFPPVLIQGGVKEIFLSNFIRYYQVLDNLNIPVKLDLYEGMWHVFPTLQPELPESIMAYKKMDNFLNNL